MITQKLEALRSEYAKGQKQLNQLERQRQDLTETMLRISGAIQVLEELQTAVAQEAMPVQVPNPA